MEGASVNATHSELIEWLRHTTPERVVDETIDKLESGVSIDDLWAAGALTAARYVSNQARNLLGFVSHAMIGCEDARQAALGQPADIQRLLLIQALAQVVVDLHDPCFSPYELLDVWGVEETTIEEGIAQLRSDVKFGEWMRADHRIVGLERTMDRDDFIDLLLDIGLEGIVTDDHTLITPALSLDMMELTGWEAGFAMLRGTMRYSCTFPRNLEPYQRAIELVDSLSLADTITEGEVDGVAAASLRTELLLTDPHSRPELVAEALSARGMNAQTVMSALSLAACDMYLQVDPVPHDDFDAVSREVAPIHIGTTLNILRASLPRMKNRTKALAVVMGGCLLERGPSILNEEFEFIEFEPSRSYPYGEDIDTLAGQSPDTLLTTLDVALHEHDVRTTTAAVSAFHLAGGNPERLITELVRVACTDDGTLMHNVKHLHSCLEEFRASQHPDRWNFLIAAAKWVSWYAGKDTGTFNRAKNRLIPQPA
jgi:hypothetical protein